MDLWHIIPPPITLVVIVAAGSAIVYSFTKQKMSELNRNEGLGLKIISIIIGVLVVYMVAFTEWTDWAWSDSSSRAHRDLVASGDYVEPPRSVSERISISYHGQNHHDKE